MTNTPETTEAPETPGIPAVLTELVTAFTVEHTKFAAGNASASTRARKVLQDIITAAKASRNDITKEKNARRAARVAKASEASA